MLLRSTVKCGTSNAILQSADAQRELKQLLEQDADTLNGKLDFLCGVVCSISDRIEKLSPLARAVHAPTDALSDQAVDILRRFDESGADLLIIFVRQQQFGFHSSRGGTGKSIAVKQPRFLSDDIESLAAVGFINLVRHNGSGDPIYAITRSGSAFAKQLSLEPEGPSNHESSL